MSVAAAPMAGERNLARSADAFLLAGTKGNLGAVPLTSQNNDHANCGSVDGAELKEWVGPTAETASGFHGVSGPGAKPRHAERDFHMGFQA